MYSDMLSRYVVHNIIVASQKIINTTSDFDTLGQFI